MFSFSDICRRSVLSVLLVLLVLPLCVADVNAEGDSIKFVYDANGNLVEHTRNSETTRFEYDIYNRKVAIDAVGAKRVMEYDARDNLTATVDEAGNRTTFVYNAINQLIATQDALGNVTRTALDAENNLTVLTDALGGEISETHDALSRLTSITNAIGKTTRYNYTADGSLKERVNADGSWIRYHRNDVGWVTGMTFSDGMSVSIEYDAVGNMTRITDTDTDFRYTYDSYNQLVKVTDAHLGTSISYAYNALGQRTQMVDASGTVVEYQYNSQELPTAIIRDGKVEITYQYDASGRHIKETLGNDVTHKKTLDANGRLASSIYRDPDGKLLSKMTYLRDPRGFITEEKRELLTPKGTFEKSVLAYQYDALGQLVKETRTETDTGKRLYSHHYRYDAQGNREQKISSDGTIVRYIYNAAGQLLKETATRPSLAANYRVFNAFATRQSFEDSRDADVETKVIDYTYDDNGNLVREQLGSQIVTYEYDIEGRLVAIDTPQGRTEYVLTPDGKRVRVVKNGMTIQHLMHDRFDVNLEVGATQTSHLSSFGIDQVLLMEEAGHRYYYHRGTANSVFQLSDAAGDVVNTYDYDAFGQPVSTHEGVKNSRTFSARPPAETSDTYYFRERLYSSRTGRFLSVDPIRAADANRSFRIGSLPTNAHEENAASVYQQRLTPYGYVHTGQPAHVQQSPIDNAVASSPLFHQRLIANTKTMGLDVSGYLYVGNNPTNYIDPTGEVAVWNPVSVSLTSGCIVSTCLLSGCIISKCVSTTCVISVCVSTSHTCVSVCVSSGCYFDSGCFIGSSC